MKKLLLICLSVLTFSGYSQEMDILLKGEHVIDTKNGINSVMDVLINDGKIVNVAPNISPDNVNTVVDAKGLYIVPGLIDIHTHNFFGTKPNASIYSNVNSGSFDKLKMTRWSSCHRQ